MYYKPNMGYLLGYNEYRVDRFRNYETLNIFSDGSFIKNRRGDIGGFAAIGVCMYDIVHTKYKGWTSRDPFSINVMELLALKEAISIGFLLRDKYSTINIFSDSSYAVSSVKNYIYKWTYDPENCVYYTGGKQEASNIELIYEISINLINLMKLVPNVNLYFIKGHINTFGDINLIKDATERFKKLNNIKDKVDYNLIRYLSNYNDIADDFAKRGAKEATYNCNMHLPIQFIPQNINDYAKKNLNE
jgi:ribonuclease HI